MLQKEDGLFMISEKQKQRFTSVKLYLKKGLSSTIISVIKSVVVIAVVQMNKVIK